MSLDGRLPEITNGCFVEVKHVKPVAERRAALENLDGLLWVGKSLWANF
jgi:hypothetical protein